MGEAARSTAGQHEADGAARDDARNPPPITGMPTPQVQVRQAIDREVRARRQPGRGIAGPSPFVGMHQPQRLVRGDASRVANEVGELHALRRGVGIGIGRQQHQVGLPKAQARPGGVGRIGHEHLQRMRGFLLVEPVEQMTVPADHIGFGRFNVHAERCFHAGALVKRDSRRITSARDAIARTVGQHDVERGPQPLRQREAVQRPLQGQDAEVDESRPARGRAFPRQAIDEFPRQGQPGTRNGLQDPGEVGAIEPGQHAITQCAHRRTARRSADHAHLADGLAATDLTQDRTATSRRNKAPGQDEVEGIRGLALLHEHAAPGNFERREPRQQAGQQVLIQRAQDLGERRFEQTLVAGGGFRRGRGRAHGPW